MVHVNLHNAIVIGGLAVLFILLVKMLAKTKAGTLPVIGDVLRVAQAA